MDLNEQKKSTYDDEDEEAEAQYQLVKKSETNSINEIKDKDLIGISGILIFVCAGRILSTILSLRAIYNSALNVLKMFSLTGFLYSKASIMFNFSTNTIFLILDVILLFLFFSKKKTFPKVFIGSIIFSFLISLMHAYLTYTIIGASSINHGFMPFMSKIAPSFISGAIWIPYLLTSVRVKNTFIN